MVVDDGKIDGTGADIGTDVVVEAKVEVGMEVEMKFGEASCSSSVSVIAVVTPDFFLHEEAGIEVRGDATTLIQVEEEAEVEEEAGELVLEVDLELELEELDRREGDEKFE